VAAQHDAALEAQQEVLPDRLHGLEAEPVHALRHTRDRGARMGRLGLDALPDERLETAGGAVERIALGHAPSVAPARRLRHAHGRPMSAVGLNSRRRRLGAGGTREGSRARAAAAGAAAATIWGLLEPLDRRLLRCDYSDVAVLGKAVTRGPAWRPLGFALHAANGAAFGIAFDEMRRHVTRPTPTRLAVGMALAEHVVLYPLAGLVDRYHPARGEAGIPPLLTNPRAFAQATWRHAVFGVALGWLATARPRLTRPRRRS
jgi:hypothetical protein